MVHKIDTTNANEKDYGKRLLIYLCTDPDNEYPSIKEEHGIENLENSKLEWYRNDERILVLAHVGTICSDVLEQVLGYVKYAGVSMHFSDILKEIKKMDK